jgi:hypothetical protein
MPGLGTIGSRPLSFGLSTIPTKTMSPGFGILLIVRSLLCGLDFGSVDVHF